MLVHLAGSVKVMLNTEKFRDFSRYSILVLFTNLNVDLRLSPFRSVLFDSLNLCNKNNHQILK